MDEFSNGPSLTLLLQWESPTRQWTQCPHWAGGQAGGEICFPLLFLLLHHLLLFFSFFKATVRYATIPNFQACLAGFFQNGWGGLRRRRSCRTEAGKLIEILWGEWSSRVPTRLTDWQVWFLSLLRASESAGWNSQLQCYPLGSSWARYIKDTPQVMVNTGWPATL